MIITVSTIKATYKTKFKKRCYASIIYEKSRSLKIRLTCEGASRRQHLNKQLKLLEVSKNEE